MTRRSWFVLVAAAALLVVATGGCFSADGRMHLMLRPGVSRPSDTDRGSASATTFAVGIGKWDRDSEHMPSHASWLQLEYSRVPFGPSESNAMSRYSFALCGDHVDACMGGSADLGWSYQRTDDGQSWLAGPFIGIGSAGYPLGRVRARFGYRVYFWFGEDANGFDMSTEWEWRAELMFIL